MAKRDSVATTAEVDLEGAHCACGAMFMNGGWWMRIGSGLGHTHTPRNDRRTT
ncbi:MAG: hypothetical protein AB7L91_12765 [Dehalococcoidia bacterium]